MERVLQSKAGVLDAGFSDTPRVEMYRARFSLDDEAGGQVIDAEAPGVRQKNVLSGDAIGEVRAEPGAHRPVVAGKPHGHSVRALSLTGWMTGMVDIEHGHTIFLPGEAARIEGAGGQGPNRGGIVPVPGTALPLESRGLNLQASDGAERFHVLLPGHIMRRRGRVRRPLG